jgi:hypothetical protein
VNRNLLAIAGACFIGFSGFTLVMPFLPIYFGQLGMRDPAEIALWWDGLPVMLLDASDATLDARLLLRGEDPRESHHERAQWRRLAAAEGWPVVDTSGPREATGAALLAWALRVLA